MIGAGGRIGPRAMANQRWFELQSGRSFKGELVLWRGRLNENKVRQNMLNPGFVFGSLGAPGGCFGGRRFGRIVVVSEIASAFTETGLGTADGCRWCLTTEVIGGNCRLLVR